MQIATPWSKKPNSTSTAQGWSHEISVGESGTEQYYPIDYTKCPKVDDYYCVVIQVSDGMVSFTNAKTVGLEYANIEHDEAYQQYRYENGVLGSFAMDTDHICYHTLANLAFTS